MDLRLDLKHIEIHNRIAMDEQISQSFLPSNWADLDSNAKLDQIMLTLTRIELNHQAVIESNLDQEATIKKLSLKVSQLEGKNARIQSELDKPKSQVHVLDMQCRSMEYNVLFYGLPEEHNENCENKILKLIQSDLKVPPRDVYSVITLQTLISDIS